jgi:hypothetical protein
VRRRRFWSLAGVAGLVAAVSLLVVPALGQNPIVAETGELRLDMDSNPDRFVLFNSAGVEQNQQLLTASNCKLGTAAVTGPLVKVAASGLPTNKNPFPGLKDHRLGVGQNGEGTGEKCAQINRDKSQSLTLSLTGELEGQSIGYAELNLEFKFNGDVTLETSLAGNPVDTITVDCNDASDCGPDSGGSDNKLVILTFTSVDPDVPSINGVFDKIVIKPGDDSPNGAISLEGSTLFRLVEAFDGEIACGESTLPLGGGNATSTITRGDDTDGGCKGVDGKLLYNFDSGTDGTELFVDFFTEPIDEINTTVAQFLEVITWEFTSPPAAPSQHRILSYDDPPLNNATDVGKQPMPWCKEDPRVGDPEVNGGLPSGPVVTSDYLPGNHTSCLIDVHSHVNPDGTFTTVHTIYNIGDGKRWS